MREMFCILVIVWDTLGYVFVTTYPVVYLRYIRFNACKFYLD